MSGVSEEDLMGLCQDNLPLALSKTAHALFLSFHL